MPDPHTNAQIEKVAKALASQTGLDHWEDFAPDVQAEFKGMARAAIAAMGEGHSEPGGVPRKAVEELAEKWAGQYPFHAKRLRILLNDALSPSEPDARFDIENVSFTVDPGFDSDTTVVPAKAYRELHAAHVAALNPEKGKA